TVTTSAGTANISGTEDGTGSAAHFNLPTQISTDGSTLYVADSGNSAIRRITLADMKVKTIGGQPGTPGKAEGNPDKSQFTGPRGIAVDKTSIYVADTGNDVIRKIDISTLQTSTIAGTGAEGDTDGPGAQAQFNNPGALCTDGKMLYVLDADNHSIRKIDLAASTVSKLTLVNGHIGSGCALTSDGKQLYFSDTTENAVEVVDTSSGNFAAMLTHCARGTKAIVGARSHTNLFEAGGASALGGIVLTAVANTEDGELDADELARELGMPADEHFAPPALVVLENTHNQCG